jgi:hypothetical protein
MIKDRLQSGEEVQGLRMQLANALTVAGRTASAPLQAPEDGGQKFPDSPVFSRTDRTLLRGCIAQFKMLI